MMYDCLRCRKPQWQRRDFSSVTLVADRMVDEGRTEEAVKYAQEQVRRHA